MIKCKIIELESEKGSFICLMPILVKKGELIWCYFCGIEYMCEVITIVHEIDINNKFKYVEIGVEIQ